MDAVERAAALREYAEQTASCTRCALAEGRTQVVFGSGSPDAELMFVGEAPGFHEDQQGVPFVGQAGKLLDKLLDGIGLTIYSLPREVGARIEYLQMIADEIVRPLGAVAG